MPRTARAAAVVLAQILDLDGDGGGHRRPSWQPSAQLHALRLHRHRVEHDAAAGRRGGAGAADRGPPAARVHAPRPLPGGRRRVPERIIDEVVAVVRAQRAAAESARGASARRRHPCDPPGGEPGRAGRGAARARARRARDAVRGRRGPAGVPRRDAYARGRAGREDRRRGRGRRVDRDRGRHDGGRRDWSASFAVGSGSLAGHMSRGPAVAGRPRDDARAARGAFAAAAVPPADDAVAVGGSAASLPRLVGAGARRRRAGAARSACSPPAPRAEVARRPRARAGARAPAPGGHTGARRGCPAARQAAPHRPRRVARGRDPRARRDRLSDMAKPEDIDVIPSEPYRTARRADRARCAPTSCSNTPTACSTRATSSACTTCGSPRGGCAPCSRSSRRASPRRSSRASLRDVKRIADALGERRDPDVHIDAMRAFARRLPPRRARRRADRRGPPRAPGRGQRGARRRARARGGARSATGRLHALADAADAAGADARRRGVKARAVKGLDPDAPLAGNARADRARAARRAVRLHAQGRRPGGGRGTARHAHRRQAAALRARADGAVLRPLRDDGDQECQGPARPAGGDPRLRRPASGRGGVRRAAAGRGRGGARRDGRRRGRPRPAGLREAPHARDHAGLAALQSTSARAAPSCSSASSRSGPSYERKGFRARLEYAVGEHADVHNERGR